MNISKVSIYSQSNCNAENLGKIAILKLYLVEYYEYLIFFLLWANV